MTSTNGANVRRAVAEFREAGYTVAEIASDLGLHRSTIYRWAAGTRSPRPSNLAALAELVDARYSQHVHRRQLTVAALHLQKAAEALVTDQQRAKEAELAARLTASFAERDRRRQAEQEQRNAEARRIRDEVAPRTRAERLAAAVTAIEKRPRSAIYALADPFDAIPQEPARSRGRAGTTTPIRR